MKIVYLCSEYPPAVTGGIGTFTRGLAEELARRGHTVHVVGLYNVASTEREQITNVNVVRLPMSRGRRAIVLDRLAMWRELRRISSTTGPIDVLEAPDFEGLSAGLPRCSRVRVVRLHGSHRYFADERNTHYSKAVSYLEKWALKQVDAVVSVSDYTAQRTRSLFGLKKPISTLHNAVHVSSLHPRKSDYTESRRVVYFGTLAEKKGVLALAQAWRSFLQTHPSWTLTIIGKDSIHDGKSVKARMVELLDQARSSVSFEGFVPNDSVLAGLAAFDFAVLPSFSEAFALAPMEAMALGLPVVYSALSSGPELIADGVNGWLCDPRSIESLFSSLERAAGNAVERARIGQAARHLIETRFSYDEFVNRNIAFYESVLSARGGSR